MGHEFCGGVAEYGPKTKGSVPTGTPVVALPLRRSGDEIHPIGLSAEAPGAYAEQVVVEESFMFAAPERARRRSSASSPSRWRSAGTRSAAPRSRRATWRS